jgi:hypothetical protein
MKKGRASIEQKETNEKTQKTTPGNGRDRGDDHKYRFKSDHHLGRNDSIF